MITGSVIGNVELLHQGFTEFSPDLKLYKKQKKVMVELMHHQPWLVGSCPINLK